MDITNAFNTQQRYAFLKEVKKHFSALAPLCAQFYTHESDLVIHGGDGKQRVLKSRSGQQQGDTLGSLLFCLGIHPHPGGGARTVAGAAHPRHLRRRPRGGPRRHRVWRRRSCSSAPSCLSNVLLEPCFPTSDTKEEATHCAARALLRSALPAEFIRMRAPACAC